MATRSILGVVLALLAAGTWAWWDESRQPRAGEWVTVAPMQGRVDELRVGETRALGFALYNHSPRHRVRVVGAGATCSPDGCYSVDLIPTTIEASSKAEVVVNYRSDRPGRFRCRVPVFTDSPGQSELFIEVDAVVSPTTESDAS